MYNAMLMELGYNTEYNNMINNNRMAMSVDVLFYYSLLFCSDLMY